MKAVITLESEKEFNDFIKGKIGKVADYKEDSIDEETENEYELEEPYKTASDLANVCEYLENSEIIKIRLIISKCEARKEKEQ